MGLVPALRRLGLRTGLAGVVILAMLATSMAQPPPWAPAHGYRHKQGLDREPGVPLVDLVSGRCNRELAGTMIGGAIGGIVGSEAGRGSGERALATVAGVVIGAFVGSRIGRWLDEGDRYCMGQALERAPDGRAITWRSPDAATRYQMVPQATYHRDGQPCRRFMLRMQRPGGLEVTQRRACRLRDGSWQLMGSAR